MTRINASIRPIELTNAHLLAEIRELPRILNTVKSGKAKIENKTDVFKLGNSESYKNIPPHLFNDWQETKESRELLKERINLRLTESKQVHRYYDRVVSLEEILIK